MDKRPSESWDVPFKVMKKFSAVNYKVSHVDNPSKRKVIHVNNVRKYRVRDDDACALTVVAEGDVLEENCVQLFEDNCNNYNEEVLMAVLSSFDDVLCE